MRVKQTFSGSGVRDRRGPQGAVRNDGIAATAATKACVSQRRDDPSRRLSSGSCVTQRGSGSSTAQHHHVRQLRVAKAAPERTSRHSLRNKHTQDHTLLVLSRADFLLFRAAFPSPPPPFVPSFPYFPSFYFFPSCFFSVVSPSARMRTARASDWSSLPPDVLRNIFSRLLRLANLGCRDALTAVASCRLIKGWKASADEQLLFLTWLAPRDAYAVPPIHPLANHKTPILPPLRLPALAAVCLGRLTCSGSASLLSPSLLLLSSLVRLDLSCATWLQLPQLKAARLGETDVSPQLIHLSLAGCSNPRLDTPSGGLGEALSSLAPQLKTLDLSCCAVSLASLRALAHRLRRLRGLSLANIGNEDVSEELFDGVVPVLLQHEQLITLDLEGVRGAHEAFCVMRQRLFDAYEMLGGIQTIVTLLRVARFSQLDGPSVVWESDWAEDPSAPLANCRVLITPEGGERTWPPHRTSISWDAFVRRIHSRTGPFGIPWDSATWCALAWGRLPTFLLTHASYCPPHIVTGLAFFGATRGCPWRSCAGAFPTPPPLFLRMRLSTHGACIVMVVSPFRGRFCGCRPNQKRPPEAPPSAQTQRGRPWACRAMLCLPRMTTPPTVS